jgi:hypothetical protein
MEHNERNIIVYKTKKRPYGVRILFKTWTLGTLGNLENVCILNKTGLNITLTSTDKVPWEAGRPMKIELEGFASATDAEASGRKLTMVLLWHAIKHGHALMLTYQTPKPVYVFERNRSSGFGAFGYGDSIINQETVIESLSADYSQIPGNDQKLLLSMEIFAASKLETSERAKFLSMVNALELLPNRKKHGNKVKEFIDKIQKQLKENKEINKELKHTLSSTIGNLKKESISQSLKRYVAEILPEIANSSSTIDAAYKIRSQIVHSGQPKDSIKDINEIMIDLEMIIRTIYSKTLKI